MNGTLASDICKYIIEDRWESKLDSIQFREICIVAASLQDANAAYHSNPRV